MPITILPDNIEVGELWGIDITITSTDAEVIEAYATATHSVQVTCLSDLAGDYSVVSSGTSTDTNPATVTPINDYAYGVVTIEETAPGIYAIGGGADYFGGLYEQWYCAPYGSCFDFGSGEFQDICDNLASVGNWASAFGGDNFPVSGTRDPDTGVITMTWTNAFGDQGTNVYTPVVE